MGSSSGTKPKSIDPTVGGLVWVRRRNGSWWPGRIMSIDELSEDCLISPRLGTPVKLLGRDDASVDWYNLEKSRRVKAFRCGEYDECIAKAQTAASCSSKKAVKYARREDAILHALELETALLSRVSPDSNLEADISIDEKLYSKESPIVSCSAKEIRDVDMKELGSLEDNSSSVQELSQSAVSFEESNQVNGARDLSTTQGRRRRTPNDSEDDGTEGVKRMRGLEDLGIGVVSSLKRKRSQVAHVHEFLKRKNRRRPLTKVLESTSIVSVPNTCEQQIASTSKASAPDSNDSKRNLSTILHNSDTTAVSFDNESSLNVSDHASDSPLVNFKQKENEISSRLGLTEDDSSGKSLDVPFVDKQTEGFAPVHVDSVCQKTKVDADASHDEAKCQTKEENKESVSTCLGAVDINISQTIEKGSSKWQLKRKRNSRQTNKYKRRESRNCMAVDETSYTFGWNRIASHKVSTSSLPPKSLKLIPDSSQIPPPQRSLPYRQSRFSLNPKYQESDFPVKGFDPDSSLHNISLEVKASHQPHVPYISLMSKLNCRPIIGHPVMIEALKDGFCDDLLAADYETGQMGSKPKPDRGVARSNNSHKSKKNGNLSKKTRKLSSLTGSRKQDHEEKKPVLENLSGQPVISCVPLKVVFSRLSASFNSSMRSNSKLLKLAH